MHPINIKFDHSANKATLHCFDCSVFHCADCQRLGNANMFTYRAEKATQNQNGGEKRQREKERDVLVRLGYNKIVI